MKNSMKALIRIVVFGILFSGTAAFAQSPPAAAGGSGATGEQPARDCTQADNSAAGAVRGVPTAAGAAGAAAPTGGAAPAGDGSPQGGAPAQPRR